MFIRQFVSVALCLASMGALSATARADFTCPDDGRITVADNSAGTTDKVLTVTPDHGANDDGSFDVEVLDSSNHVLAKVHITTDPPNNPPITLPPGSHADVVDPKDSDTHRPSGKTSLV